MDNITEAIRKIIAEYDKVVSSSREIADLDRMAKTGVAKLKAAKEIAKITGGTSAEVLLSDVFGINALSEEEISQVVTALMKHNHGRVIDSAKAAQETINVEAGVGLNPAIPGFDDTRANDLAQMIINEESAEAVKAKAENSSMAIVDELVKMNARLHNNVGLLVSITRTYDGVGLHNRKTPCRWCIERAGTWSYDEAQANGVFERHVGCGCNIVYRTTRFTHMQRRAGSAWEDITG